MPAATYPVIRTSSHAAFLISQVENAACRVVTAPDTRTLGIRYSELSAERQELYEYIALLEVSLNITRDHVRRF